MGWTPTPEQWEAIAQMYRDGAERERLEDAIFGIEALAEWLREGTYHRLVSYRCDTEPDGVGCRYRWTIETYRTEPDRAVVGDEECE